MWDQFWADLTTDPSQADRLAISAGLNQPVVQRILDTGGDARRGALALRENVVSTPLPPELVRARQLAAAHSILSGRDQLVRTLDPTEYGRLHQVSSEEVKIIAQTNVIHFGPHAICQGDFSARAVMNGLGANCAIVTVTKTHFPSGGETLA